LADLATGWIGERAAEGVLRMADTAGFLLGEKAGILGHNATPFTVPVTLLMTRVQDTIDSDNSRI